MEHDVDVCSSRANNADYANNDDNDNADYANNDDNDNNDNDSNDYITSGATNQYDDYYYDDKYNYNTADDNSRRSVQRLLQKRRLKDWKQQRLKYSMGIWQVATLPALLSMS